MPSNYPSSLDAFTTGTLTGVVSGSDHGNKGDALNKIEAELGTDPSGSAATVGARLDLSESGQPINVQQQAGADNAAKLNAAITALPASGAKLVIPRGTYTGSFTITGKDHLTIEGEGSGTVVHNTTGSVDALKLVDCDDVTVQGVRVQGASGTRDGLHLENCQRATVRDVYSGGTGRAMVWAQRCFGILVDGVALSVTVVGGIGLPQAGLVLTWDGGDVTSGCNEAVVNGGTYVVGQTPQASVSTATFTPGWAIQLIRVEGATITGPINELSAGGVYLQFCSNIVVSNGYCELNPSDVEYSVGTVSVTNTSTAVVGAGTSWDDNPASPEVDRGAPGKYLVAPIGAGMAYAKVASLTNNTNLVLAAQTEILQTGWPGATNGAASYRLVAFDVFMDNSSECVVTWSRGGGAIALRSGNRNRIKGLTDSVLLDGSSNYNTIDVTSNRANWGASRIVDQGTGNRIRELNYQTGVPTQDGTPRAGSISLASATTLTLTGDPVALVSVTGSTTVTSVAASWVGRTVTLLWAAGATFDMTDGSNLKLSASITTFDADDTLSLICDGTNWYETGRSVN